MEVKIYSTAKSAMQSGRAKMGQWILEYERPTARRPEPLMGWSSAADTYNQVKLKFDSEKEAVEYAVEHGWSYDVRKGSQKRIRPRNYGDNFKYFPPKE